MAEARDYFDTDAPLPTPPLLDRLSPARPSSPRQRSRSPLSFSQHRSRSQLAQQHGILRAQSLPVLDGSRRVLSGGSNEFTPRALAPPLHVRRSRSPLRSPRSISFPSSVHPPHTLSPSLGPLRYQEGYPTISLKHTSSGSSLSSPSTPTSIRSRSPSISSLDPIPDSPDAEAEALEDERQAALEAAKAPREAFRELRRRNSTLTSANTIVPLQGKRKRWSVCGAERRGDLDLETIWED
jgi:hypothetical protein